MRLLPTVNSTEVVTAPTHTSRHATGASGRTLKIVAKRTVTTIRETSRLSASSTIPALLTPPSASPMATTRSEEHTSELQSQFHLVCRLLLEKKKKQRRHVFCTPKKKNNIQ